jgi:2-polyprenyl-3-methyl-5-hydroxy-6-metoxy-1,4-benzoquinol methylase
VRPEAYEQFARLEREHWWFRGRRKVYLELLRAALGDYRPGRVLDIGSGCGGFLEELETLGEEVHHTDLSHHALSSSGTRSHAQPAQASATALPYASMSFDLVCLFDVLEHIEDDAAVLEEVERVLNPEGVLILSVPAHHWLWSENDRVAEHVRRYSRSGLLELLGGSHLILERCTFTNAVLFPAIAAFVLASEAARSVGLAPRGTTNLSVPAPRWLDATLYRAFVSELPWARRWDLPIGHSLVAILRKRERLLIPISGHHRVKRAPSLQGSLIRP